jgi:membrane-anchored glycerophosphoryl diester phosphodiesterase (GDPDase)
VLLYPEPPIAQQAMTPEQAWAFFEQFYRESLPFTLAMSLAQTVGAMAILRLFAAAQRATVGDAIAKGVVDAAAFLASVFAASVLASIGASLIVAVFALTGLKALAGIAVAVLAAVAFYLFFRLILIMPAIAVDGLRNPLASFRRSWALTRGNAARIALFLVLLMLAYGVVSAVASAVLGLGLALVLGAAGAKIAVGIVTSALGAVFVLYVFAALAAIHRQLAGPSPSDLRQTFD